jgi:hypothetical protein
MHLETVIHLQPIQKSLIKYFNNDTIHRYE